MAEATKQDVDSRHAYLLICGIAIIVSFFKTLTVLTLASRTFAFYYTLQYLVAFNINKNPKQKFGIALVAAALGFRLFPSFPICTWELKCIRSCTSFSDSGVQGFRANGGDLI